MDTHKKYAKAYFAIQSEIDVIIFLKIVECEFSKVAWDTLESAYKGSTKFKVPKV